MVASLLKEIIDQNERAVAPGQDPVEVLKGDIVYHPPIFSPKNCCVSIQSIREYYEEGMAPARSSRTASRLQLQDSLGRWFKPCGGILAVLQRVEPFPLDDRARSVLTAEEPADRHYCMGKGVVCLQVVHPKQHTHSPILNCILVYGSRLNCVQNIFFAITTVSHDFP